jgi:Protein phosphatase 2C
VSWRVVGASVVGTSHRNGGRACEDFHATKILTLADGCVVLLAVADGAGAAAASAFGARTAVLAALDSLDNAVRRRGRAALAEDAMRDAVAAAAVRVLQAADQFGQAADDYASTLALVAATGDATLVAHVGDGAVVAQDDVLQVLSFPAHREYANATTFLVDADWRGELRTGTFGPMRRLAVMTDGLQALALDYKSESAFVPFFEPLFAHIESAADASALDEELAGWLASPAVNERTSDDKTLVIAVREP